MKTSKHSRTWTLSLATMVLALVVAAPAHAENWTTPMDHVKETLDATLNWDVFVIETAPVKGPEEMKQHMPAHKEYLRGLESQGVLLAAGPITNRGDDKPSAGFILVRAESLDDARLIADEEPMHKNGVRSYVLRKWTINEGHIEVSINLSDQSFTVK